MIDDKLDRKTAREVVFSSNVFTTHTPVPAGNDVFPIEMMQKYFVDYIKQIDMNQISKIIKTSKNKIMVNSGSKPYISIKVEGNSNPINILQETLKLAIY